jgi:acetyltransferase-like isoleucine patch superfamily enzyme
LEESWGIDWVMGNLLPELFVRLHRAAYFARGSFLSVLIRAGGGRVGRRLRVEGGVIFRQAPHAGYELGDDIFVGQCSCFDIDAGARFEMGSGVTLAKNVFISAIAAVRLGDYVQVGENSSIRDADHGMVADSGPICEQAMSGRPVDIGSDVWIGRGVAVLAGSMIGEGSVIGANSVVRGRLGARCIAVGAPAVAIRQR